MNPRKLPPIFQVLLSVILATLFYAFFLSSAHYFATLRLKSIDSLFGWRAKHSADLGSLKDIVVIGLDDESYNRVGRAWPWGREVFATFTDNLQKLNPKVVGFDFAFIGNSPNDSIDQWLANTFSSNKNVILATYFDEKGQYIQPLEIFVKAAHGLGFIDKPVDLDRVNRRARAVVKLSGDYGNVYSFASSIANVFKNRSIGEGVRLTESGDFVFENTQVSADPQEKFWISYRYEPKRFEYIPFWKVIVGKVDKKEIEGKIVLVGITSPVFHDDHATPLGPMSGLFINANEVAMILEKDFIHKVHPLYQWAFVFMLALVTALVFYHFHFFVRIIIFFLLELLIYQASIWFLIQKNLIFEPFSPMFVLLLVYIITLVYKSLETFLENTALQRQVIMDSLTGLYGHRYLTVRLESEFNKNQRFGTEFCLAMLDIDFFKKINDTYGHQEGNHTLIEISKILKNSIRSYDIAARYGGEEFSLILLNADEKTAFETVSRIRAAVESHVFRWAKGSFYVTLSAGICSSKHPQVKTKDDLLARADEALYQAKREGRNRVCIYNP